MSSQYIVTDSSVRINITLYSDYSCVTTAATSAIDTNITIPAALSTGYKLDAEVTAATLTPVTADAATNFNSIFLCGYSSGWSANVARDIVGMKCAVSSSFYISAITPTYDKIYIKAGSKPKVYRGDPTTGDGLTDATRPKKWNNYYYYQKQ